MKRTPRKRYVVRRTYPLLFWRQCRKCKQEFRREWGWKFFGFSYMHAVTGPLYHLCATCAPTVEDADALARSYGPRGKPPQTGSGVQHAR